MDCIDKNLVESLILYEMLLRLSEFWNHISKLLFFDWLNGGDKGEISGNIKKSIHFNRESLCIMYFYSENKQKNIIIPTWPRVIHIHNIAVLILLFK